MPDWTDTLRKRRAAAQAAAEPVAATPVLDHDGREEDPLPEPMGFAPEPDKTTAAKAAVKREK